MSLYSFKNLFYCTGVTTPEDLIEDDEWERMVEAEHSRVMRKAKEAEVEREREHKISIGIGDNQNRTIACVFFLHGACIIWIYPL